MRPGAPKATTSVREAPSHSDANDEFGEVITLPAKPVVPSSWLRKN